MRCYGRRRSPALRRYCSTILTALYHTGFGVSSCAYPKALRMIIVIMYTSTQPPANNGARNVRHTRITSAFFKSSMSLSLLSLVPLVFKCLASPALPRHAAPAHVALSGPLHSYPFRSAPVRSFPFHSTKKPATMLDRDACASPP